MTLPLYYSTLLTIALSLITASAAAAPKPASWHQLYAPEGDSADASARPGARSGAATALLSSRGLLVFGGQNYNAGLLGDAWVYSFTDNLWRSAQAASGSASPSARANATAAQVGDAVVLYGGACDDGRPCADALWVYRLGAAQPYWQAMPSLTGANPPARTLHASVSAGYLFYVYGGLLSSGNIDTSGSLWRLSLVDSAWTELPPAGGAVVTGRYGHAGATDGTYAWLHGGVVNGTVSAQLLQVRLATAQWQVLAPSPSPRAFHLALLFQQQFLLLVGGITASNSNPVMTLVQYDVTARIHSNLTPESSATIPVARQQMGGALLDGSELVVYSGAGVNHVALGDVWALDLLGTKVARGSATLNYVDANDPSAAADRLVVWSEGAEDAASPPPSAASFTFNGLRAGNATAVAIVNGLAVTAVPFIVPQSLTLATITLSPTPPISFSILLLHEDRFTPLGGATMSAAAYSVIAGGLMEGERECVTGEDGRCGVKLRASVLENLPEIYRSSYQFRAQFAGSVVGLQDNVAVAPDGNNATTVVMSAKTLQTQPLQLGAVTTASIPAGRVAYFAWNASGAVDITGKVAISLVSTSWLEAFASIDITFPNQNQFTWRYNSTAPKLTIPGTALVSTVTTTSAVYIGVFNGDINPAACTLAVNVSSKAPISAPAPLILVAPPTPISSPPPPTLLAIVPAKSSTTSIIISLAVGVPFILGGIILLGVLINRRVQRARKRAQPSIKSSSKKKSKANSPTHGTSDSSLRRLMDEAMFLPSVKPVDDVGVEGDDKPLRSKQASMSSKQQQPSHVKPSPFTVADTSHHKDVDSFMANLETLAIAYRKNLQRQQLREEPQAANTLNAIHDDDIDDDGTFVYTNPNSPHSPKSKAYLVDEPKPAPSSGPKRAPPGIRPPSMPPPPAQLPASRGRINEASTHPIRHPASMISSTQPPLASTSHPVSFATHMSPRSPEDKTSPESYRTKRPAPISPPPDESTAAIQPLTDETGTHPSTSVSASVVASTLRDAQAQIAALRAASSNAPGRVLKATRPRRTRLSHESHA